MTDERRQELMKEQKKYLLNRIDNLEDTIAHYQKLLEDSNKEIEHLKSVHQRELHQAKEDAYTKFLEGSGEYLERFVKEFIQEKLVVDINIDGPYVSSKVLIAGEHGQSSTPDMIQLDDEGTFY